MDEILLKDGEIIEKDTQITSLKSELDNLANQLRQRMDEVLLKDSEITYLKEELNGIYNSEGFRFVLRPLWIVLLHTRSCLKALTRRLTQIFWFAITVTLTPVFLLLSLSFLLEYASWVIIGPMLKRIAPKRKIKSIKDKKISLVMPNYNGIDCLKECLPSIFAAEVFSNGQNEILVVDDGSTDGSVDYIRTHFPQVRLILNKRNRGFGFTCNRGIKSAQNEVIVLINNDIILTRDFLKPLIGQLQKEDVFVVTPKLYAWDRKTFVWGMHMGCFENGYIKLWNEAETGNGDRVSQTSPSIFAIGGAMLFRKSDFLWLGGFDSIYRPNCWEDIDLSYRAWKRGLKVLYEPKSLMYHKGRATLTYERPKEIKNELLFTWKNITDAEIVKNHLSLLPWNLYRNRMNFLKGFFWALNYLPQMLLHRFLERRYIETQDKKTFNHCMLYYRNFIRRGFRHLQDNEKRNVLIITPFMPYPLNSGGKIRIYTLAKLLSNKFDISLLTLINHKEEVSYIPELKKVFKEVYAVFSKTEIESKLYPQRYKYAHSHILIDKLNEIQRDKPIDIIQIESNELLYLADYIKHIPIVYTEHDSSVLFFKDSYYQIKDGTIISNFFDYLKRVYFHHSAYKKLDRIILLSGEDEQILLKFFPKGSFSFIPTGVDIKHFSFVHSQRPKSKRLIYVGHYPHYPNEDAVIYFIKKIFPRIRRQIPEVEFLIVGSNITERIRKNVNHPNIRMMPDVDDVWPYLRESAVFINPVRISAGIKGKVLEAMATGLPVVSTKVGAFGISAKPKEQILIADEPFRFARAVIKLLQNEALYSEIAKNARRLVEEKYDWQRISQSLIQVYEQMTNFIVPPIHQEVAFDKIIDLSHQIVEEALERGGIRTGAEHGPEELHIELTYRCDSQCIMCDLWDYHTRSSYQQRELNLNEIKQFVEESGKLKKIKTVVLSGGEPFLRRDLEEICGYFIKKFPNISIGILTNGVNTKNIITTTNQILQRYKPKYLWLGSSLDGVGDVHDKIRAKKGAFYSLERTIRACKKEGINITLTFTLTTQNFDQLISAKRFADNYGLEFYIQFVVPKEVREKSVFNFSPLQLTKIESDFNKIMQTEVKDKDYQHMLQNLKNDSYQDLVAKIYYLSHLVKYQRNPRRYFRKCIAGTKFAMLSPSGNLYFCPGLKNGSIGNIRKEKFDNLWTSKKAESIREFISQELCHCWLVCVVFPVIDEARASIKESDKVQTIEVSLKREKREERKFEHPSENGHLLEENSNLNEQEYQQGKISLESTPRGIGIGAHWHCNANCIFCLGGYPRFFDLHTYTHFFEKRLSGALLKAEFINLCGFGELLLMPRCEEFLDYINQTLPSSNKVLTTNGIPLSKTINQRLTESKYSLQISLHASDKRLHRMLTHTEAFDQIVNQIQSILSTRKNKSSPSVNLVFIINTLNIERLPDFVKFASKLGVDSVSTNYMTVYTSAHLKLSCFFKQKIANRMLDEAEELAARAGLSLTLPPKFGGNGSNYPKCPEPWQYLYVETEGSILPCCYAGAHIGYLYRDDLQEVWNGEFYKHMRSALVEGRDEGWCKYCYKNKPSNVNDIRSHISFRTDLQQKILKGFNLK
jgi:MoaA/NifB/PqqE/SkfB family radical SAM enzyme/GT2 family glycosyltransferase/glycosyltransferase involved in cell wall biosynthesis